MYQLQLDNTFGIIIDLVFVPINEIAQIRQLHRPVTKWLSKCQAPYRYQYEEARSA